MTVDFIFESLNQFFPAFAGNSLYKELPAKAGKNWFKLSKMKSTVIYLSHLAQYQDYLKSPKHLKVTNPQQSHPLQIGQ